MAIIKKKIAEGSVVAEAYISEKISRELPVFYNPEMRLNRDISIFFLKAVAKKGMILGFPLAGTGIRGIRMLAELESNTIKKACFNDYNEKAVETIKNNLLLNKELLEKKLKKKLSELIKEDIEISCKEANIFLGCHEAFDYIDIDPFGSPNQFLDTSIKKLKHKGILAVTATDTAALCGSYAKACKRKYWAEPERNELMHETGIRILIRKVQLIAAQYSIALVPCYSYARKHYFRVFFEARKGKKEADKIILQHKIADTESHSFQKSKKAGPLWAGKLYSKEIAAKIAELAEISYKKAESGKKKGKKSATKAYVDCKRENNSIKGITKEEITLIKRIAEEAAIEGCYFYDLHKAAKSLKLRAMPRIDDIIDEIKKKNAACSRTHFSAYGIKAEISKEEFIGIIKKLEKRLLRNSAKG